MYTIYMHTVNGKSYIGQTCKSLSRRINKDFSGYKGCSVFWNVIQKYGVENIITEILCECNTLAEANYKEKWYIERFNTLSPNGYNLTTGGDNKKLSVETRKRISAGQKGRPPSRGMLGKKHSLKSRQKMSESHKGQIPSSVSVEKGLKTREGYQHSPETRRLLSETKRGSKNPMYGKSLSAEHRRKISESHKGQKRSLKTRERIRESWVRRKSKKFDNSSQLLLFK